jgi:transposase
MKYSGEFKLEAADLISERGLAIVRAARDINLNQNMLRPLLKKRDGDPKHASLGVN